MKKYIIALSLLAGCPKPEPTLSLELLRIGETTITTTAGDKSFSLDVSAGSILIEQLNLVDLEGIDETRMIAEPLAFDFIADAQISIPPVFIIPGEYEQVHVIPGRGQTTASMLFQVTLSSDAVVSGELSLLLPFVDEQQIDAAVSLGENEQKKVVLGFAPARLFDGVDFDLISNGADFVIEAGSADPNITAAFDLVVENTFVSFALIGVE